MLVLDRKPSQRILIGRGDQQIIITLVEVRANGHARIGIDAPKNIAIHREEVAKRLEDGNAPPEREIA